MGIPGLTTFLNSYAQTKFVSNIWLQDCTVIVDGFNAAFYLYHYQKELTAHIVGGDYVGYADNVRKFFQHMKSAKLFPVVVFDGAHQEDKFWTVNERFRNAIEENVNSAAPRPAQGYVPIGLKTAFIEILKEQNVFYIQTLYEADDTIAYLSWKLNAPVLSSDSDFQVYYFVEVAIPFQSIEFCNNNEKVFSLHAKTVSLKVICRKAFNFTEDHVHLTPYIGLVFGNDKCATIIFENFARAPDKMNQFKAFLELIKESNTERKLQEVLVEEAGASRLNEDSESAKFSKIPPTDKLAELLNTYAHCCNNDKGVWHMLKMHRPDLIHQEIVYKKCNISVRKLESPVFDKKKIDEAPLRLLESEKQIKFSKSHPDRPLPGWFIRMLRTAELSPEVLDLMANNTLWLWPQVETSHNQSSQEIAINILKTTSILLGCNDEITINTRAGRNTISKKMRGNPFRDDTPTIYDENFRNKGSGIFLASLGCQDYQDFINEWPSNARFVVITLLFFLKQRRAENCYAIGVGVLMSVLKANIESNNDQPDAAADDKISSVLKTQKMTKNIKSLYGRMEKRDKLGKYELSRVYRYCEYKAVFAHAKTLNALLGNPFKVPRITSLNSYIVYHVHEVVSTNLFDNTEKFVMDHMEKEPLGKILLRFLKFSMHPPHPVKQSGNGAANAPKVVDVEEKLGKLKL